MILVRSRTQATELFSYILFLLHITEYSFHETVPYLVPNAYNETATWKVRLKLC
jgi:hypothetical protein